MGLILKREKASLLEAFENRGQWVFGLETDFQASGQQGHDLWARRPSCQDIECRAPTTLVRHIADSPRRLVSGGWDIGRIYEPRGGPEHLRWFWSFAVQPMTRSDRVAGFEEAKAQFHASWEA